MEARQPASFSPSPQSPATARQLAQPVSPPQQRSLPARGCAPHPAAPGAGRGDQGGRAEFHLGGDCEALQKGATEHGARGARFGHPSIGAGRRQARPPGGAVAPLLRGHSAPSAACGAPAPVAAAPLLSVSSPFQAGNRLGCSHAVLRAVCSSRPAASPWPSASPSAARRCCFATGRNRPRAPGNTWRCALAL